MPTPSPAERKPADEVWAPTENPNATVVPGKMRSDREEIPGGFSKADADKAETMEAKATQGRAAFAAAGCQVYWPAPYEVCGAIRDKYNELGGPNGFLLWPTSGEIRNPDGQGVRNTFTNGPIYWAPWAGAHPVVNHFFAAWQRQGWEGGVLGYPTTDEIVNPDGVGRRQEFDGGAIYWRLNEAYAIGGAIRDK
ncbi:LGFP repeat-containing protein [Nocardia asteroides]|uniref:LGFP repeat-containing protein n=1 Tax=Nocardia asteroides TaxID=1824 RepID=UPI0037CC2AEA